METLHDMLFSDPNGQVLFSGAPLSEIDLDEIIKYFVLNIFRTELHSDGIEQFKRYFDIYQEKLSHNQIVSLATIFIEEEKYKGEYNKVCYMIKQNMKN